MLGRSSVADPPDDPVRVEAAPEVAQCGVHDRGALNRATQYERLSRPKGPRGVSA